MQDIQTNRNSRNTVQKSQSAGAYFKEPSSQRPDYGYKKNKDNNKSQKFVLMGFIFSVLILSGIAFLASFVFDGATITIRPVKKDLQVNETYIISPEERAGIIEIKKITLNDNLSMAKNATKTVNKKAEGQITVYNNFDKEQQKLIKGTRFMTDGGKTFRIKDSVTVPGKQGDRPGEIVVNVIADSEGDEYNVPPTNLNIPGFKGSLKFKAFYARSFKTMIGGSSGKSSEVSDLDMEKGKSVIRDNLKKAFDKKLANEAPKDFTYDKDITFIDYGSPNLVESEKTTAKYNITATATAVFIKKNLLIKKIIEKTQGIDASEATVSVEEARDFILSITDPKDIDDLQKPIKLIVTGNASATFNPNKEKIINYIAGKNRSEFESITKNIKYLESASNVVRPFWSSKFPSNKNKITVN